jgi:hypothetical protein
VAAFYPVATYRLRMDNRIISGLVGIAIAASIVLMVSAYSILIRMVGMAVTVIVCAMLGRYEFRKWNK